MDFLSFKRTCTCEKIAGHLAQDFALPNSLCSLVLLILELPLTSSFGHVRQIYLPCPHALVPPSRIAATAGVLITVEKPFVEIRRIEPPLSLRLRHPWGLS
jgi:hypothetical protein